MHVRAYSLCNACQIILCVCQWSLTLSFLFALVPPSVISALANESIAIESRSFSTQCTFESRPAPLIKWYINADLLKNGSRFRIDSDVIGTQNNLTSVRSILTINKVITNDAGRISCLAEIPFGTLSSNGTLIVHCK